MESSNLVVFVSQAAQAGGALVMALVLVGFHRLYQREYLRTWAWSWWAFCVWMAASGLGQLLAWNNLPRPEIQTLLMVLSLISAYWNVAWLLFGTYELATTRGVPERTEMTVLGALLLLAVIPVLVSAGESPHDRLLTQEALRNAFLAMAYLVASYWIWNAGNEEVSAGLGQRILSGAFLLNTIQELHYLSIHLGLVPTYTPLLVPFDFLLQFLLGVGMVIWLLEEERRRVIAASARAEHLAYHDTLTDLPNRNLLVQHMTSALHRAERRAEGRAAVLFLDLDRFKVINDSLGHNYGDEILRAITERLRRNLLETETVARMGGDGFAVLLPVVSSEWKIAQVADKILGLIRRPFAIHGTELYVTASIGISRFPDDGGDPDELLKKAEIAMYHAKEHGGDQYQVYAPTMDANALERLALENDLRKALVHGELVLFYQPVLDARTGCIESVEALLRWQHPERGLMGPAEFLWLAEVTGMSNAVDLWVLRTACREIAGWNAGGCDVRVAVNLSTRPFQRPDLLDRIQEVLAETGLPANMLQLEDHRDAGDAERRGEPGRAARPEGAGHPGGHRRLRHRVLVAELSHVAADRHPQGGPLVRERPRQRPRQRRDHGRGDRPRPQPGARRRGRRRGDRSPAQDPARPGVQQGAGLSLQPAGAGGPLPRTGAGRATGDSQSCDRDLKDKGPKGHKGPKGLGSVSSSFMSLMSFWSFVLSPPPLRHNPSMDTAIDKTLRRLVVFLSFLTLATPARAGVGVWTPLGPEGGPVWALAVDPGDPGDADIVYAGTRNGVFKSTDAGATWTAASKGLGPAGVWVRSLAVTTEAVYAGTDANGVYKSTDGGATWAPASTGLPPAYYSPNVGALVADPRSPNRIWAGTNRGVYLTTNGGLTWQERRRGLPFDVPSFGLTLTPDGKTLYVSNLRAVFKTTNQGKKWTRVSNGLIGGGFADVAVDPAVPSTVFAGGPGLWKSTNGGAKWTQVAPSLFDGGVRALAWQGTRLFASLFSVTKHGIWFSDDHGATWTAAAENPSDPYVTDIAAGPDLVYAGTSSDNELGGVFRSPDHGRTWDLSIAGLLGLVARGVTVDPSDPGVLYTGIDYLGVFKSIDRGATWERLDLLPANQQILISATLVDPSDPSTVYAGSGFGPGGLFRSRNAGTSWEKIDEVLLMAEALAADPRTPGAVWAAGYPGLYHTDDRGETWERLPVPGGGDIWLRAFQVDPHAPNVLWAAGTLFEVRPGGLRLLLRLFRSTDAGQTWQRRETGLAGTSVVALAVDPANPALLLAGTDTGLYRTADAGLTWTQVPGFSAEVNAIVAAPTTPTAFYAHLTGFGVQRSIGGIDGGTTWTPARRGLAPVPVNTLAVDPNDPRQLYAGSQTRGVFAYTEP